MTDGYSQTGPIQVLLADDQALVLGALAALLNQESDIEVLATFTDAAEVASAVRSLRPDVALLDIEMPGRDGIDITAEVSAHCRVLIVTTFGRPGYLRRALDAGASGFVVKDTPPDQLADAIRRTHAGLRVVDPQVAEDSLFTPPSPLTGREAEIAREVLAGHGPRDIAKHLYLSPGTVRNHLSSMMAKTGAANRFAAARVAEENGWI